MSKVLIPNIIITRDYDAMTAIFSGDKYVDPSKLKSDNKLFFLSANKNKYLTSFEYDLDYRAKDKKFFKINFIDSDGNFESEFLESSFLSQFTLQLAKKLSTIKDVADSITQNPTLGGQVYIAFGVGEDLANWSDPHVCRFIGAEIQIDANGRRVYSFQFDPSSDPIFRRQFIYDTNAVNYQGQFLFLDKLKYILNVKYETPLNSFDSAPYKHASGMIRRLLVNYLKDSCDTKNIIVLLPNFDYETDVLRYNRALEDIKNNARKSYFFDYRELYSKIFGLDLIMNTAVPKNIEDAKAAAKNYLKSLNSSNKITEYTERIKVYKFEIDQFQKIIADLQKVNSTNNLQRIRSYQTQINDLKTKIFDLELAISDLSDVTDFASAKQNLAAMLIDNTTKFNKQPNLPTTDYMKEYSEKLIKILDDNVSYILKFQDHLSRKSSVTPNTFDWYQCLNRVFKGIGTVLGLNEEDSKPYLYEETDLKIINLWYKNGIIPNNKDRCVVLGVKSVVNNYLYRNSSVFDRKMTTESTIEFKPKYKLEDSDLSDKLMLSNYPKELFEIVSRKKMSSAFSEQIILDELAVNPAKPISQPFLKFLGNSNILKLSDTPIFMNNLKNSNIRSIDVKNLASYWGFMNFNVKDDFVDELILSAKSLYDKSNIRSIVRKDFETLISEVVKRRMELMKASETYYVSNGSTASGITKPLDPAKYLFEPTTQVLSKETRNTYNKLLERIQEKKYSNEDSEYSYDSIFASLAREVGENINSASRDLFDSDDKIAEEVESLSLLIEALFTIGRIKTTGDKPIITLADRNGLPNEKNVKASLFQYLYKTTAPTVTIRTLPFFHLSNSRTISGKTAILLSKKTISQVSPMNPQLDNLENSLDFFSGVYNIIGAKHVITTSDCYSEFVMQKLITETIN